MRMCQVFLVLLIVAVAINDAVSASTADEWSKLTSRGLDQETGTDIDGDRMLRARDESADETGEERGEFTPKELHLSNKPDPLLIPAENAGAFTSESTLERTKKVIAIFARQHIINQHSRKIEIARDARGKKLARIGQEPVE